VAPLLSPSGTLSPLRIPIVSFFHHIPQLLSEMIGTTGLGHTFDAQV